MAYKDEILLQQGITFTACINRVELEGYTKQNVNTFLSRLSKDYGDLLDTDYSDDGDAETVLANIEGYIYQTIPFNQAGFTINEETILKKLWVNDVMENLRWLHVKLFANKRQYWVSDGAKTQWWCWDHNYLAQAPEGGTIRWGDAEAGTVCEFQNCPNNP